MTRVVVRIDSLVVSGFRHEDRLAIADGLQGELGRILADPGSGRRLAASTGVPRLRLSVRIANSAKPGRVGEAVARGIGREMKR